MEHRLSLERIEQAATVIDPVFLHTPQFHAESLSQRLQAQVFVKIETLNPIRSFKGRGAAYFVASLASDARVICASAGNFGQAMAFACRKQGFPLTVYASVNANPLKLDRMRALGAQVVLHGDDFDTAKLEAKRVAHETGMQMVEDGLEPRISEGAGTIGLELTQGGEPVDALLIPLGNGALLGGVARWIKARWPSTQIVAVQSVGAPSMIESWRQGRVIAHPHVETIADGIAVRIPIPEAVQDMDGLVDDAVLVQDATLIEAMRLAHQHLGIVLEPAGAAGLAGLLESGARFSGQTVATVLCGGNLTPEQMRVWLA
jgi:threonine dehydratase